MAAIMTIAGCVVTCTWNRGVLCRRIYTGSFAQLTLGKGGNLRRVIWWPRYGQIGVRVWGNWWMSAYWHRSLPGA